jgi:hypothetical protein
MVTAVGVRRARRTTAADEEKDQKMADRDDGPVPTVPTMQPTTICRSTTNKCVPLTYLSDIRATGIQFTAMPLLLFFFCADNRQFVIR